MHIALTHQPQSQSLCDTHKPDLRRRRIAKETPKWSLCSSPEMEKKGLHSGRHGPSVLLQCGVTANCAETQYAKSLLIRTFVSRMSMKK